MTSDLGCTPGVEEIGAIGLVYNLGCPVFLLHSMHVAADMHARLMLRTYCVGTIMIKSTATCCIHVVMTLPTHLLCTLNRR